MQTRTILLLAVATMLTLPASAVSGQETHCLVEGYAGCFQGSAADGFFRDYITIQGNFGQLELFNIADELTVSCWICEGGTCGDTSVWGPVSYAFAVTASTWQVVFQAPAEVPSGTAWPAFASYFCRVGLGYTGRDYAGVISF